MSKKFEYVDDNPGSYFGMLVESLNESNDYNSEVKDYNIYAIKKDGSSTLVKTIHGTIRDVEDEINSKFSYLPKLSFIKRIEVRDNNTGEKVYDESLKEDSEYKTLAKLSNGLEVISYPYGYAVSDGYVADRFVVRDGKYIFDDGRFRLSDKDKEKILSLIKKGVIEESLKESYSKSDLYSALEYMYGFNKKEANDWIKKASDKMKQSVVDGWKGNAKKSALTDSLKEDKFVSRDKMSKKELKESIDYLEADLAKKSGDKDIYDAYDENELTIVKDGNMWYFEHCPRGLDKKVKTLMKKYYPELNYLYDESLKEDKFVSRDKMSKKDRKELDSKKRNTWGNTNPVTRVQPNKKAYDRKRDKKVVDEDIENKDSEEYLGVDEVKRFVNAREKLLDISDSMTTDLRLGRISREDVLYYRNEIKEIYSFLNSLYFGR